MPPFPSRSASTRTQSIRRTSLREKMNTTKKDVQDEKLYFIQSFDAIPKSGSGTDEANGGQKVGIKAGIFLAIFRTLEAM